VTRLLDNEAFSKTEVCMRTTTNLVGGLAAVAFAAACVTSAGPSDQSRTADSTAGPGVADVAGTYQATTFTTRSQSSQATTDQLAQGATLTIVLDTTRATTGRLFVPVGDENGNDLDASMAGTWALSHDSVGFSQAADTFVRDMPFVFANGALTGEGTFSGTVVRVVLTKQ
jgi:hypothetical protein